MRSLLLIGGLAATMAVPALANAQSRCERERSENRAVGTVVGAGVGALLGSAIAGNSSNTAGTIVGGVAGAVAGNQIAKNSGQPCPTGYYEVPGAYETSTVAPAPGATAFWERAPAGIRERIEYMEDRVDRGVAERTLTRREAMRARQELADIRRMADSLRRRDDGLTGPDREYLQTRLDQVGREIRWMQARN